MSDTGRDWYSDTPPRDTWVWARYSCGEEWRLFKTCKRGCCVYSAFGTMLLPNFWKPATPEEGEAERAEWQKLPKLDPMKLYEEIKP